MSSILPRFEVFYTYGKILFAIKGAPIGERIKPKRIGESVERKSTHHQQLGKQYPRAEYRHDY